jgi:hypothetical protein
MIVEASVRSVSMFSVPVAVAQCQWFAPSSKTENSYSNISVWIDDREPNGCSNFINMCIKHHLYFLLNTNEILF